MKVAEPIIIRLRSAGFRAEITGHVRLGLDQTIRPYILVSPLDIMRISELFGIAATCPISHIGPELSLVLCAPAYFGAHHLTFTGPMGYLNYIDKCARNLGYTLQRRGPAPGIYHRQTLIAAREEDQIFDVLGLPESRRSFDFRKKFSTFK